MRHLIALSLAVFVPLNVAKAVPAAPACPAKDIAIKEQGVRAPLAPAASGAASVADMASSSEAIVVEKVERGRIAGGTGNAGPTDYAINTKGTGANSGRSSMAGEYARRDDLQVSGAPGGSAGPTIAAHAINTKGTGTTSGRASSKLAIKTKGTSAQRQASSEMAINTKGTGAAGRVVPTVVVSAPGPDEDCDG